MYCDRNEGEGVPSNNHDASRYEFDVELDARVVKKRRCIKHPDEFGRYICKDHEEVLCPKCLVTHKQCDFDKMGEDLNYESKKRFRNLLNYMNLRHNMTLATERKLNGAMEGLDLYGEIQKDEIVYSFNEVIKVLNKRKDFLISQVDDVVGQMKK